MKLCSCDLSNPTRPYGPLSPNLGREFDEEFGAFELRVGGLGHLGWWWVTTILVLPEGGVGIDMSIPTRARLRAGQDNI